MYQHNHMNRISGIGGRAAAISMLFVAFAIKGMAQNTPTNVNTAPAISSGKTVNKPAPFPSTEIVNYTRTWSPKQPYQTRSSVTAPTNTISQVDITTDYTDGFGRPMETVKWQSSPSGGDLVTPHTYNSGNQEVDKFLTYTSPSSGGAVKADPFGEQSTFFGSTYLAAQPTLTNETFFYTEDQQEASPLNRVLSSYKAGNSWVGNNIGTQKQYLLNDNTDQVQIWNITSGSLTYVNNDISTNIPTTTAVYQPGTLAKSVTTDENGNMIVEFKDEEGLLVFRKVQAAAVTAGVPYTNWLCTYFVYDDLGRQRFVISPKAVAAMVSAGNWALTANMINELCYRYEFDARGRKIANKKPGYGWVYTVYDQMNRPVFEQDGNLRLNNQWLATLYDGLDRMVETAVITYASGPVALQASVSANTGLYTVNGEAVTGTYTPSALPITLSEPTRVAGVTQYLATQSIVFQPGFSTEAGASFVAQIVSGGNTATPTTTTLVADNPLPSGANPIAMLLNYYDNYTNTSKTYNTTNNSKLDQGANPYADALPSAASILTAGLATSTKVRVIESATNLSLGILLETANFYDDKGRLIQTQSDNYKGGIDYNTNRYDFGNKVVCNYMSHNNPAATVSNFTVKTNTDYDVSSRKVELRKTILDVAANTRILEYDQYDALGMLNVQKLGQKSNVSGAPITISNPATDVTDWLEVNNLNYNINGWLKGMNWSYVSGPTSSQVNYQNNMWFGMDLSFDWGFNTNQLNGNIAGQRWVSAGDSKQRAYGYGYDNAERLLKADFTQNFGSGTSPIWATADPNSNFTIDFSVKMGDGQTTSSAYDANGNILQMQQMGLVLNSKQQIDNLIYTYEDNQTSNKVRAISDQSGSTANLGDFQDNNTTADDYGYDLNGNLITDLNKRIAGNIGVDQTSGGGIIYSYKNLPWQVSAKNPDGSANGTITFIYDANGRRLEKRTNILASSFNNNTASNTINSYLGPFIYTNNALQYFLQEDGKVRPTTNTSQPYVYDYFLKDHLQDTRMVLTDEQQQVWYPAATVELTPSTSLPVEEANYEINTADITLMSGITGYNGNYPNNNGNPPYNTNPNSNTSAQSLYMYKLNGATGDKTGLGITIKVMTGDQVNIWGKAFYNVNGTISNTYTIISALNAFISSFATTPAIAAGAHGATAAGLESSPVTPGMLQSWLGSIPTPAGSPKAYINWILFDEQFRPVTTGTNSGFLTIGTNPDQIVSLAGTATITTSGYLYVYCSNESNNDVYFDNLQVEQTRGPLLEENHYYPFGLSMAGLNSKVIKTGYTENKRKFVGKELDDDLALDWYQFEVRDHDPQIGRFHQIDPSADKYQGNSTYAYSENRPVNGKDQEGREYDWYNMYMMYKDLTSGGFGYGSIFSSLQSDMQADFRAQNQGFGNFNTTQPISQQVQDNQTQAAIANLNVIGDMGNLETKMMNDGLTLLTLPSPEFTSLHMVIEGAETKNYTEVGLALLTFGVSGAYGYLATDLQAASFATDAMTKTDEMRDFATGVESVLRNNNVALDQVSVAGNDYGNKFIIVGRDMDGRIIPAVQALHDAGLEVDYWNGWSWARTDAQNLAENTAWIKEKLAQGYSVIDIGLSPEYTIGGNFDFGDYYQMESNNISQMTWLYKAQTPN